MKQSHHVEAESGTNNLFTFFTFHRILSVRHEAPMLEFSSDKLFAKTDLYLYENIISLWAVQYLMRNTSYKAVQSLKKTLWLNQVVIVLRLKVYKSIEAFLNFPINQERYIFGDSSLSSTWLTHSAVRNWPKMKTLSIINEL